MFNLLFDAMPNTDAILRWHDARGRVYKAFAEQRDIKTAEVYFGFSDPNAGWADISVYCDGKKLHTFPISAVHDPFSTIKAWLEDIVNDYKLGNDICIDAEGRTIILHYEHLRLAEVGVTRAFVHRDRNQDKWLNLDAMNCPDLGLFYIYDSALLDIPVVCCCETKQFLSSLYHAILEFARDGMDIIGREWYMDTDDDGNPIENWQTLYNEVKSPMIEWGIYSTLAYRHCCPIFNKREPMQEMIHMWPDWGEACFWDRCGIGCGDTQIMLYGDEQHELKMDTSGIEGLQEWYDEFDIQDLHQTMSEEAHAKWLTKGWEVAKRIRRMLPPNIDLYYMWKTYKGVKDKNGYDKELYRIVPDIRDVDERYRDRVVYKFY